GWSDEEDLTLPADPPHSRVAHTRQPNGRVGLLIGPGCRSSVSDMKVTPVVRDFLFRPKSDHDLEGLGAASGPLRHPGAKRLTLFRTVPQAHAENEPPLTDVVQRRHLLRH